MARCDTYARGNCTKGACELAPWIPDDLGDGGDWAADYEAQGGQVTMLPTQYSVVCYCRGDGYSGFGHVGLVLGIYPDGTFDVREENFIGLGLFDTRRSTLADVCGFLLAPGMVPGSGGPPAPAQGGPPGNLQLPPAVVQAWEVVRWWTNDAFNYEQGRVGQVQGLLAGLPL